MVEKETEPALPDRITMGLLPYLSAHAVDEDYADLAAARAAGDTDAVDPKSPPTRRRMGSRGAAVLAVFAVLTITAGLQTSRNSGSDEKQRNELIQQVQLAREGVDAQRQTIRSLEAENGALEDVLLSSTASSRGLVRQVQLLSLRSGVSAARGPGVEIIADDAPNAQSDRNRVLDSDLQKLVNGLWQAGAEAISINGERLTVLSAIRHAGSAITVNFTSLNPPYRILAIGDADRLPARFAETTTGQAWLDLRAEVGLQFSIRPQSSVRLPGAGVPTLRFISTAPTEKTSKGGKP